MTQVSQNKKDRKDKPSYTDHNRVPVTTLTFIKINFKTRNTMKKTEVYFIMMK